MACTACLVCLVSTVSGLQKNALGKGSTSRRHFTKLKQSTFLQISMVLTKAVGIIYLMSVVISTVQNKLIRLDSLRFSILITSAIEQHALKNVNNCMNSNNNSYLETSGFQSSSIYLNVVLFSTPLLIRHLWQLKTAVFLQQCLMHAVLLYSCYRSIFMASYADLF